MRLELRAALPFATIGVTPRGASLSIGDVLVVDRIEVACRALDNMEVEIGGMDYGFRTTEYSQWIFCEEQELSCVSVI